ncbi:MAG: HlyD family efflux transporter periplasmic adaptor subunit [Magnetococcus sp. YQC-5]
MNTTQDSHGLAACAALLDLEREARRAESEVELRFLMVNRTLTVLPAAPILFWRLGAGGQGAVEAASGVSEIDAQAPLVRWAGGVCKELARGEGERRARRVKAEEVSGRWGEEWCHLVPPHGLWTPLMAPNGLLLGGLLLLRPVAWGEGEQEVAQRLGETYAHAWLALGRRSRGWAGMRVAGWRWALGLGVVAAGFIGVEQSSLAPAAVVPAEPWVVAAPLDGVVESVLVEPNAPVLRDDLLFKMEATAIANRREMALLALETARAELFKARQLSFSDLEAKAGLPLLEARIAEKSAEADYADALLKRTVVRAPQAGIAIYSDPNTWRGRPVAVGERVMVIAEPSRVEMEIRLPVADAVVLTSGVRVLMFLHVDPVHPLEGVLTRAAYDAEMTPEGVLAYRITARFAPDLPPPRIGLKGTAKIIGEKVILFYYLFRRPWAALRQAVGF